MEKVNSKSLDLTKLNIEKIKELFPSVVTEGKIDFDMLRTLLGDEVDDSKEKFQFTWKGKNAAIKLAQSPSSSTLRPDQKSSKNWDVTENLYIEGDNFEVLKQLQKTYYGKIKMIYIDPPYNTGNDFVYKDNFKDSIENYKNQTEQGMSSNPETNGRYHTDWLNMMYSRLLLARKLLTDDGVIFISIDDNELSNLLKIAIEIFDEKNNIGTFIWTKKKKGSHLSKTFRSMTEYILCFAKNINNIELFGEAAYSDKWQPIVKKTNSQKTLCFSKNIISTTLQDGLYKSGIYAEDTTPIEFLTSFEVKDGYIVNDIEVKGPFVWIQKKLDEEINAGTKISLSNKFGFNVFRSNQTEKVKRPPSQLDMKLGIGTNEDASNELIELFGKPYIIDYPKPVSLIKYLIKTLGYYDKSFTFLDFFSGSATSAEATMRFNIEENASIKFIMVQLPEKIDESEDRYKYGYKNICEIGKERIRRSGEKIKDEWLQENSNEGLLAEEEKEFPYDIGFKVYKLDSTNIKPWDNSSELDEKSIFDYGDVFKEGRTKEDILYEIMLKYGVFDMPVSEVDVNGKTMYRVGKRYMIVCLEDSISSEDVKAISELSPKSVVFKEDGFKNDNDKINAEYNLQKAGVEDIKCI